jgi:hypothetical protein
MKLARATDPEWQAQQEDMAQLRRLGFSAKRQYRDQVTGKRTMYCPYDGSVEMEDSAGTKATVKYGGGGRLENEVHDWRRDLGEYLADTDDD